MRAYISRVKEGSSISSTLLEGFQLRPNFCSLFLLETRGLRVHPNTRLLIRWHFLDNLPDPFVLRITK